ncbi:two pore domain potassium channel family protein [Candidatus Beckwithbacteria bacterium]|nr:two pore domain potassium channel family protein [Candidatus Beckwithbacteria bacterium]
MSTRTKLLLRELFTIYKIQKFLLLGLILVLVSAIIVPFLEYSHDQATITSFGDGLWWALVTVSSTGYGDFVPVTFGGKVVGVILMFSGIALFSTVIALVASFYAHRRTLRNNAKISQELDELMTKVDELKSKVDYLVKDGLSKK